MTKQEVEQSLPFRAVRKILKKTYPWITRIEVPEDVEKYNSLIFLEIYFDPYKFLESYPDYVLDSFYTKFAKKDNTLDTWGSTNMGVFFSKGNEYRLSNEKYEMFRPITNDITKILSSVGRSSAFPDELRLHNNRTFDLSNFYIDPNTI